MDKLIKVKKYCSQKHGQFFAHNDPNKQKSRYYNRLTIEDRISVLHQHEMCKTEQDFDWVLRGYLNDHCCCDGCRRSVYDYRYFEMILEIVANNIAEALTSKNSYIRAAGSYVSNKLSRGEQLFLDLNDVCRFE